MSLLNLTLLPFTEVYAKFLNRSGTDLPNMTDSEPYYFYYNYHIILFTNIFTFGICCFGIVMNGTVIWILGSSDKVHPFTIYILNLAIADVGVLASRIMSFVVFMLTKVPVPLESPYFQFFLFMCMVDHILLTAISVDRCVYAFFPIWYQHHQSAHLSIILCIVVWILCFLFSAIHFLYFSFEETENASALVFFPFKMTSLVCLPIVTICTLILVVKLCFKRQQSQHLVHFTAIVTVLLSFFLFSLPLNVICIIPSLVPIYVLELGCSSTSLKSSLNPVIYFLVGRQRGDLCTKDMKLILQRIFSEGGYEGEEQDLDLEICYSNPAIRASY